MLRRLFIACGFLLVGASLAVAQGTTSRLVGHVTDGTGAVLPGVTVTITNEATGVSFNATTSDVGTYVIQALVSGLYTVKVELQGFKTTTVTGNWVEIG